MNQDNLRLAANRALIEAASRGHANNVREQLSIADPLARDSLGCTALMAAARGGHADCVALLLPFSDAGALSLGGATALSFACRMGHADCVALLLPYSDANHRQNHGNTPLRWAVDTLAFECVDLLLAAGARVDEPDDRGRTPLMTLSACGNALGVSRLLAGGADPLLADEGGETALMKAAGGQWLSVARILAPLSSLAAVDCIGQTALMRAGLAASPDRDAYAAACIELLAPGSNVLAQDVVGNTALDLALRDGRFCSADAYSSFMPMALVREALARHALNADQMTQMPRWAARLEAEILSETAGIPGRRGVGIAPFAPQIAQRL